MIEGFNQSGSSPPAPRRWSRKRLVGYAYRLAPNQFDPEDVVQTLLERVPAPVSPAYDKQVIRNIIRDLRRRERLERRVHAAQVAGTILYEQQNLPARPTHVPTADQQFEGQRPTANVMLSVRLPGDAPRRGRIPALPFEEFHVHVRRPNEEIDARRDLMDLASRARVPEATLRLLLAVYGEDLSIRDAAQEAGLPSETARRRIHKAFQALRRAAKKLGAKRGSRS